MSLFKKNKNTGMYEEQTKKEGNYDVKNQFL